MKVKIPAIYAIFFSSILLFTGCGRQAKPVETEADNTPETVVTQEPVETPMSKPTPEAKQQEQATKQTENPATASGNVSGEKESQQSYQNVSNFDIKGKWKNVGTYTFGQVQAGAIVVFDGKNCNVFSPQDTYAFYKDGNSYTLDCTSMLFSETVSFKVKIVDNNNIHVYRGSNYLELKRVE